MKSAAALPLPSVPARSVWVRCRDWLDRTWPTRPSGETAPITPELPAGVFWKVAPRPEAYKSGQQFMSCSPDGL